MKSLHDYITESQQWIDTPATGDDFALNIRQECLLETYIVDVRNDGVVLHADERMMSLLKEHGAVFEEIRRYGAVGSSTGRGYTLGEEDQEPQNNDNTYETELAGMMSRAGVGENANSNDPLLAKSLDDAAVPAMEAANPQLQDLVGKEFYVKAAGRRGQVVRVSPEHLGGVIVQFDDGDMDIVHFTDLASDDPSFMRKMMDRLSSPMTDRPIKVREANISEARMIDVGGFQFDIDAVIRALKEWYEYLDTGDSLDDTTAVHIEHALNNPHDPEMQALWNHMQELPRSQFSRVIGQIVNHASRAQAEEDARRDDPGGISVDDLREDDDEELDGNAYEMGYRAAALYHRSKNSNPFEYGDPRHDEWEAGWREGAAEEGLDEGSCVMEDEISMAGGLSRDLLHWYQPQLAQAIQHHGLESVMDEIDQYAREHASGLEGQGIGTTDRHRMCQEVLERLGISRAAMRREPGGIEIDEAEYQGRKVALGKPMRGDVKKFKVYVRDPATGNVKKVNFGHGGTSAKRAGQETMRIKKSNPERRRNFRARHNCDNPGPRTKARYWSCRAW